LDGERTYNAYSYDVFNQYNEGLAKSLTIESTAPILITNVDIIRARLTVNLSWADPDDINWKGTIVVKKFDSPPTSISDGSVIINTTIKDQYRNNPYIDSITSNDLGKTVYYKFHSYDGFNQYNEGYTKSLLITTTSPSLVSNVNVIRTSQAVNLKWTDSNDYDWAGTKIVRSTNRCPLTINETGSTIILDSTIRNQYQNTPYIDEISIADIDKVFYYTLFSYDVYGTYNNGVPVEMLSPQLNITNLVLIPTTLSITLTWNDPNNDDWVGTRVIRKEGSAPINQNDGIFIENITARNKYQDTPLIDATAVENKIYFYGIFPYNNLGYYNISPLNVVSGNIIDSIMPATNFNLTSTLNSITVSYNDPMDNDWVRTKVVCKIGSYPENDADGRLIINKQQEINIL
jgi:hypothetical protein